MHSANDTAHSRRSMSTHGKSEWHNRPEMKYFASSEENAFKKIFKNVKATIRKRHQVNSLYLRKYIHKLFSLIQHLFFLIQHLFALTNNNEDLIDFASNKLHELIINQYLDSCLKNVMYNSNTSVESLLDALTHFLKLKTYLIYQRCSIFDHQCQ